jgi:dynein heavy chain, axonemal
MNLTFFPKVEKWKIFHKDSNYDIFSSFNSDLNEIQKLIIVQIFHADCLIYSIRSFIINIVGEEFTEYPAFNLNTSFEQSSPNVPLVLILSSGNDPITFIYNLAQEKSMNDKIYSVSLGQGQSNIAYKSIQSAIKDGSWVILQNCHLMPSFLTSQLDKIFNEIQLLKNENSAFRLWLTSYSTHLFPSTVLESSIKITNESPQDLKSNLLRCYTNEPISQDEFFRIKIDEKSVEWHRLLFGICFFHAVVQERTKFGSLGFRGLYTFRESDLNISICQLRLFIEVYNLIPFQTLNYLIAEINYGAYVADNFDRRLMNALLHNYFKPNLIEKTNFEFFSILPGYYVPDCGSQSDYLDYIRKLPDQTDPQIFGLNTNANFMRNIQDVYHLFQSVLLTLPRKVKRKILKINFNKIFLKTINFK